MISTVYINLILRELSLTPNQEQHLFHESKIDKNQFDSLNMIENDKFDHFLSAALKYRSYPSLPLSFGRYCGFSSSGEVGYYALSAPRLIDVLQSFADYSRAHASAIKVEIKAFANRFQVIGRSEERIGESQQSQFLVFALIIKNIIDTIIGQQDSSIIIGLTDHLSSHPSLQEHFKTKINYQQSYTYVEFSQKLALTINPFANHVTWQQGKQKMAKLLEQSHSKTKALYTDQVHSILNSQKSICSLAFCAQSLFMSERTLTRKLINEGTNFRTIQQEIKGQLAKGFLRESNLSIEAIAFELGYQDSANFRRAFKRWFSISPQQYRQQTVKT